MSKFKDLFVEAMNKFINVNVTPLEANEIYSFIKNESISLDNVSEISIDQDEIKVHYFYNTPIGDRAGVSIYRSHSDKYNRDGKGSTIVIKGLSKTKVLVVGKKVRSPYHKNMVTVIELGDPSEGINQFVKIKTSNGVIISTNKHSLLGLFE